MLNSKGLVIQLCVILFLVFTIVGISICDDKIETDSAKNVNDCWGLRYYETPDIVNCETIHQLHCQGKDVIDSLIDYIDKDEKITIQTLNPLSSYVCWEYDKFIGNYYAYVIGIILFADQSELGYNDSTRIFFNTWMFSECQRIERKDKTSMKLDDMKKIKKYYETWWSRIKTIPLDTMRATGMYDNRPLDNTEYEWVSR